MDLILVIALMIVLFYGYRGYHWYNRRIQEKRRNDRMGRHEPKPREGEYPD